MPTLSRKTKLAVTTALTMSIVSTGVLTNSALAQTTTISTPTVTGVDLGAGESAVVTGTGSITTTTNAIFTDTTADSIEIQAGATVTTTGANETVTIRANGTLSGGLRNFGTISQTGLGANARRAVNVVGALGVGSGNTGGIVNEASGIITSTDGSAIGSVFSHDRIGDITNYGTVTSTGGAGTAALDLVGGTSAGSFVNYGTMSGNEAIRFGGPGSLSGGLTFNAGSITTGTSGTAISLDLNGLTPITINGGAINGDVTDANASGGFSNVTIGGDFSTNGDFTVSSLTVNSGANLTISSGDRFTYTGGTSTINGTLTFEVGPGMGPQPGRIIASGGSVIDLTGATVEVDLDPATVISVGNEVQVGSGSGAVIGFDGNPGLALTKVTDNSLLFDFSIADGSQASITSSVANDELFLLVQQQATAASASSRPNNSRVGGVLDSLSGSSDSSLSAISGRLGAASTTEALDEILEATLPGTVDSGSFVASSNTSANTFSLAGNRLAGIRSGGGSSGIASGFVTKGLQIWGQVFGQKLEQDERSGVDGFKADTYGVAIGFDTEEIHNDLVTGIAFAYANTDVDSDNANRTETEIDSYQIAFYGDYDVDAQTYVSATIGYTFGDNESTRFDVGGVSNLNANADFNSHQFSAQVSAGRSYEFTELSGFKLTPNVLANYLYYQAEDFTETGAGGANLSVDNDSVQLFELGFGLDISRDYKFKNGSKFTPELSLGYRYDFLNEAVQATSTFVGGGSAFEVEGFDPARSTFNVGLAASYEMLSNWDITGSYDYETKSDFDSHAAFIRASYKF